jgi:preprotein translocase subunit YajC
MAIILYFVAIAAAFFLLIVLPQRRRATAHRALIEALGVGDEVVTIGGIFGTIQAVDDERIELEVAPGVVVTVARNAIAQIASSAAAPDPAVDDHPADNGASDD